MNEMKRHCKDVSLLTHIIIWLSENSSVILDFML